MRPSLFALFFLLFPAAALTDDKPDVVALKKQIAEAEAKLADLKSQLAKVEGEPTDFKDVELLRLNTMKVGESGRLGYALAWRFQKVEEIFDSETALLALDHEDASKGYVLAKGFPTKGYVTGKLVVGADGTTPQYWGVVGTSKQRGDTVFVVRPVEQQKKLVDLPKGRPEVKPERQPSEKKPEPKPLPKATLTPPKDDVILLGEAAYFVGVAQKEPAQRAKWEKDGKLKPLTAPTVVEVISRDKEFSKVRLDGREWAVETRWLAEVKK